MNKRSFLKSLLTLAVAPQIILSTSVNRFKWKRAGDLWIINPEYVNAPFEIGFLMPPQTTFYDFILAYKDKPSFSILNREALPKDHMSSMPWPYRLNNKMEHVAPFIKAK